MLLDHDDRVDAVEPDTYILDRARARLKGRDPIRNTMVVNFSDHPGVGRGS